VSGAERAGAIRVVPERSAAVQIGTVFGGFLLGPLVGLRLAMILTPGSDLVQTLSVFAFAAVFVSGILIWAGLGIVAVVVSVLLKLARGRPPGPEGLTGGERIVPPGHRAFVLAGPLLTAPVGALGGLLTELSVLGGVAAWSAAGLAYGWLLRRAARTGYLPFPEPE